MKIKLNEYQQSLFDSPLPMKHWYERVLQQTFTWLLIVGLYYQCNYQLSPVFVNWLNFGVIFLAIVNTLGIFTILIMKFAFLGFKIALNFDNLERLNAVYKSIKGIASTGFGSAVKIDWYRIVDLTSDLILFSLLISANYLTVAIIFFATVSIQWALVYSTINSFVGLLSKVPDSLNITEKVNMDKLMDDLISGKSENDK